MIPYQISMQKEPMRRKARSSHARSPSLCPVQWAVAAMLALTTSASIAQCDGIAPALLGVQLGSRGTFPSDVKVNSVSSDSEELVIKEVVGSHDGIPDQIARVALWRNRVAFASILWTNKSAPAMAALLQRLAAITGDETLPTVSLDGGAHLIPCGASTTRALIEGWGPASPNRLTMNITGPLVNEMMNSREAAHPTE